MIDYIAENYERLKDTVNAATLGNYSDDFYHYLILELHKKKDIEDKESFIFIFAKNHYFWKTSKWNQQQLKEELKETEPQQEIIEELSLNDQQLNRYLHTYDNEVDEVHKKIIKLFICCKNEYELYTKYKIHRKTLQKSIEYVSRNFNHNSNSSNITTY